MTEDEFWEKMMQEGLVAPVRGHDGRYVYVNGKLLLDLTPAGHKALKSEGPPRQERPLKTLSTDQSDESNYEHTIPKSKRQARS
jgi:hypothetical protein